MRMSTYNFYYDESEHSRVINYNTVSAANYYDNFVARVKHYRDNYNIVSAEFDDDYGDGIFEKILDFISKNLVYVIFFLIVLLLIVFVIVMMRKRKKRGVLE